MKGKNLMWKVCKWNNENAKWNILTEFETKIEAETFIEKIIAMGNISEKDLFVFQDK